MILAANNDRVRESTATVGAGDLALLGAVVGFRAFSAVLNDQDVRPYTIEGLNSGGGPSGEWETGLGTYNAGLNTLSRTTVLASSNAGAAVVLSAGAKQVWIDAPAAFLSGLLQSANNLADVANVATARHSLGLDAVDAPTFAGLTLTGRLFGPNGTAGAPGYSFTGTVDGLYRNATGQVGIAVQGAGVVGTNGTAALLMNSTVVLGWCPGALFGAAADTNLVRDAAGVLAQRNGVNSQRFRIYNTFTDASNYERGEIFFDASNTFTLATSAGGTGTPRSMRLQAGSNLFFSPGATDKWIMQNSGHFSPNGNDGLFDLGIPTARIRNIFAAGGVGLKVKAGAIVDADFNTPTDGMLAADSTNSKLWMRLGGVWKSVVLA